MAELVAWGYPDYADDSLCTGPTTPSAEGSSTACDRCKVPFVVSAAKLDERFGECKFHPGRIAPERVEGRRKWIYSCCKRERGEAGCTDGVHVFSEKEEDGKLASRYRFRRLGDIANAGTAGAVVVGLDCEMVCKS